MIFGGAEGSVGRLVREVFAVMRRRLPANFHSSVKVMTRHGSSIDRCMLNLYQGHRCAGVSAPLMRCGSMFGNCTVKHNRRVCRFVSDSRISIMVHPSLAVPVNHFLTAAGVRLPHAFCCLNSIFVGGGGRHNSIGRIARNNVRVMNCRKLRTRRRYFGVVGRIGRTRLNGRLLLRVKSTHFSHTVASTLKLESSRGTRLLRTLFAGCLPQCGRLVSSFGGDTLCPFLAM